MIWLILITVFSLALGLLLPKVNTDKCQKIFYLFVIFTALTVFGGVRDTSVGIDTANYFSLFYEIRDVGLIQRIGNHYEIGFLIYTHIIAEIFGSPTAFLLISQGFICFGMVMTIYRYSDDVVMSTFIFTIWFYTGTLNTMRQYMALAFVLLGLEFILKKKPVKYLIMVLIAMSFHQAAVIYSIFVIFSVKGINYRKIMAVFTGIMAIGVLFFDLLFDLLIKLFPKYAYLSYTDTFTYATQLDWFWIIIFSICAAIAVLYDRRAQLVCISSKKKHMEFVSHSGIRNLFLMLFVISIFLIIMTSKVWMVTRINSYFRFSFIIIMPYVMAYICNILKEKVIADEKSQKICIGALHCLFYGVFFVYGCYMLAVDGHGILLYKTIFG